MGPKKPKKRGNSRRHNHKEEIEVLFEDEQLIAIDKPAGLLSVPIRGGNVPSALSILEEELGEVFVVHRLDRYSSGVLVFARTSEAREALVKQFLAHTPVRVYRALTRTIPHPTEGKLVHHFVLGREGFRQQLVQKPTETSARAELSYKTIATFGGSALVEVTLVTGLKNQIRAQFAAIGTPLIGEHQYAPPSQEFPIDHQALYASRLEVQHPKTAKTVRLEAKPPQDFLRVIESLKKKGRKS